ncbi:MAG: ExbD/TolR family protein [Limisphaerales bacterium]
MRFKADRKNNASLLDITPIVDTVFNLLIFFALSLNFVSTPGIQVNLPKSSAREVPQDRKDFRIIISSDGQIYANQKPIDLKTLSHELEKTAQGGGDPQVLIQADQQVAHGKVVEVMDLARRAGLSRLAIVTRTRNPGES